MPDEVPKEFASRTSATPRGFAQSTHLGQLEAREEAKKALDMLEEITRIRARQQKDWFE